MSAEFDVDPTDTVDDGTPPPESVPKGPTPEEIAAIRGQLNALTEHNRRLQETNDMLTSRLIQGREEVVNRQPRAEEKVPDRDEDPDGYIQYQIDRKVREVLQTQVQPLGERASRDRAVIFGTATALAVSRVRDAYPDLWAAHGEETEKFLSQFDPEQTARPEAVTEALFRVVGAAEARKTRETAGGGRAVVGRQSAPPIDDARREEALTDDQQFAARRAGTSPKMFNALRGTGSMSVDEFLAAKAAETKKKGAANA